MAEESQSTQPHKFSSMNYLPLIPAKQVTSLFWKCKYGGQIMPKDEVIFFPRCNYIVISLSSFIILFQVSGAQIKVLEYVWDVLSSWAGNFYALQFYISIWSRENPFSLPGKGRLLWDRGTRAHWVLWSRVHCRFPRDCIIVIFAPHLCRPTGMLFAAWSLSGITETCKRRTKLDPSTRRPLNSFLELRVWETQN